MLLPPPRFQAFDPNKHLEVYRRNLPHWRQSGATYFITCHTRDALPRAALEDLERTRQEWLLQHPPPHESEHLHALNRLITIRTEHWLHQAHGSCPFRHLEHRQKLYQALLHFHGTEERMGKGSRVEVGALVIMPNHIHALARPLPGFQLEDWIGSIKQFVATRTPPQFKIDGHLWQKETHDRIVRDLRHLNNCLRYIGKNPRLGNVPSQASHTLWINPDWAALGWSL